MQSLGESRAGERREGATGGDSSVLRSLTWSSPGQWLGPTVAKCVQVEERCYFECTNKKHNWLIKLVDIK